MARPVSLPRPPAALKAVGGWLRRALARLRAPVARFGPVVLLVLAGIALIVSEFLTYREIVAVTVVPEGGRTTGGEHHGYALALIGLVSLPMSYGAAIGRSRPAAAAVAALGGLTLAIVGIFDTPSLDDTGLIGRTYDLAEARPAIGFWLETACGTVLLVGGLLLLRARTRAAREQSEARHRTRRQRAAAGAEAAAPSDAGNETPPPPDAGNETPPPPDEEAATGSHAAGSRRPNRRR